MAQRLPIAFCFFALFVTNARAQSAVGRASQDVAATPAAYPDSPKGLQDFLEVVFAAIKANDKPKIDSLWQSTQLPDHIDVLGQVRSASILSGDLVLGNAARAAVLGWRYRPYIQNGRPVDVETTVTVTFPL